MNEKYTGNKGCAGLLRNPAHPLFPGFFHRQCVSHNISAKNVNYFLASLRLRVSQVCCKLTQKSVLGRPGDGS